MENNYPPGFIPAGPAQDSPIAVTTQSVQMEQTPSTQPVIEQPQVASPGQAPTQAVETHTLPEDNPTLPDIDDATLTRALEVLSGGRIKSRDELGSYFEAKDKLPTYEARMAELTQKAERDPFASPVARKINEMLSVGATTNEIENFVRLQNVDVAKLEPLEAIRMAVKAENPEFDSALVDAVIAEDYGLGNYIEGEQPTALDKARLIKAQKQAVEKINSMKVLSETPASVAQAAQQTVVQQQKQQAYQTVTKSILGESKIDLNIDGDVIQFPIPQAFQTVLEQQLLQLGMQGQWSLDEQGAAAAKEMARAMVVASHFDAIQKATIEHIKAKAFRAAKLDNAGPAPKMGHTPPTQQPAQAQTTWEKNGWPNPSKLIKD